MFPLVAMGRVGCGGRERWEMDGMGEADRRHVGDIHQGVRIGDAMGAMPGMPQTVLRGGDGDLAKLRLCIA